MNENLQEALKESRSWADIKRRMAALNDELVQSEVRFLRLIGWKESHENGHLRWYRECYDEGIPHSNAVLKSLSALETLGLTDEL